MRSYIGDVSGDILSYDNRIFGYDFNPILDVVEQYFQTQTEVYDIIHVSASPKDPKFKISSGDVNGAISGDQMIDYSWYYE